MIASLTFTGRYLVGVSSSNKIKVNDHTLSLSDIPFVRYRFDKYDTEEFEFIAQNKQRFKGPVHLAEITLGDDTKQIIDKLDEMFDNIAKFVYVPIYDEDIANGLNEKTTEMLKNIEGSFYDRLMIKDKTSMLYPLAASRIKLEIEKITDFEAYDIGICGSPLSFKNSKDDVGQACLTAVWSRKILSDYADSVDVPEPTAAHECMKCCGCAQYIIIDKDYSAPADKKQSVKNNSTTEKVEKVASAKLKGVTMWDDDL